eukprot:COSAG01_NODE_40597_length_461_cov_6.773481_1_plen_101_part_01
MDWPNPHRSSRAHGHAVLSVTRYRGTQTIQLLHGYPQTAGRLHPRYILTYFSGTNSAPAGVRISAREGHRQSLRNVFSVGTRERVHPKHHGIAICELNSQS